MATRVRMSVWGWYRSVLCPYVSLIRGECMMMTQRKRVKNLVHCVIRQHTFLDRPDYFLCDPETLSCVRREDILLRRRISEEVWRRDPMSDRRIPREWSWRYHLGCVRHTVYSENMRELFNTSQWAFCVYLVRWVKGESKSWLCWC